VKDLEGQKSSYEEAIGGTKNASVIASLVKRLEDLDTELSAARTKARMAAKEAARMVDPKEAALQVKEAFQGFRELPAAEQKALLNQYVTRIDYDPPSCAGDISAMFKVTMRVNGLRHSKTEAPS
jgi:uncharacterized protein YgbK (DUF1537 family)